MASRRQIQGQDEFLTYRGEIERLYITNDLTLPELMKTMLALYQFKRTKAQYEAKFREWNLRKNSTKDGWQTAFQILAQRKRANKESKVLWRGKVVDKRTLQRKMGKYRNLKSSDDIQAGCALPPEFEVRSPSPMETTEDQLVSSYHFSNGVGLDTAGVRHGWLLSIMELGPIATSASPHATPKWIAENFHTFPVAEMRDKWGNAISWHLGNTTSSEDFGYSLDISAYDVPDTWLRSDITRSHSLLSEIASSQISTAELFTQIKVMDQYDTMKNVISGFNAMGPKSKASAIHFFNVLTYCVLNRLIETAAGLGWGFLTILDDGNLYEPLRILLSLPSTGVKELAQMLLHCALECGHANLMKLLVSTTFDVDTKIVWEGIRFGRSKEAEILAALEKSEKQRELYPLGSAPIVASGTLLYVAVGLGNIRTIKALLECQADVNAVSDRPPLKWRGTNRQGLLCECNTEMKDAWTPIIRAAYLGLVEVCTLLVAYKANVNAQYQMEDYACTHGLLHVGETALQRATYGLTGQHLSVVRLLLDAGADINPPCSFIHNTPIQNLLIHRGVDSMSWLQNQGADFRKFIAPKHTYTGLLLTEAIVTSKKNDYIEDLKIIVGVLGTMLKFNKFTFAAALLELAIKNYCYELFDLLINEEYSPELLWAYQISLRDPGLVVLHELMKWDFGPQFQGKGESNRVKPGVFMVHLVAAYGFKTGGAFARLESVWAKTQAKKEKAPELLLPFPLNTSLPNVDARHDGEVQHTQILPPKGAQAEKENATEMSDKTVVQALGTLRIEGTDSMEVCAKLLSSILGYSTYRPDPSNYEYAFKQAIKNNDIQLATLLSDHAQDEFKYLLASPSIGLEEALSRDVVNLDALELIMSRSSKQAEERQCGGDISNISLLEFIRKNKNSKNIGLLFHWLMSADDRNDVDKGSARLFGMGQSDLGLLQLPSSILCSYLSFLIEVPTESQSTEHPTVYRDENLIINRLQFLIQRGADVNTIDNDGQDLPLQLAVETGMLKIVQFLVEQGAQVNPYVGKPDWRSGTAIHDAVSFDALDIVQYLLDVGASPDPPTSNGLYWSTPLICAVQNGNYELVDLLIEKGADINRKVQQRGESGKPEFRYVETDALRVCLDQTDPKDGPVDIDIFALLLAKGALCDTVPRPPNDESSALTLGVVTEQLDIVKMLLEAGAKTDPEPISRTDDTPLDNALVLGLDDIAIELIKAGARINYEDGERDIVTPIQFAAESQSSNFAAFDLLIEAGANIFAPPIPGGATALQYSVREGRLDRVVRLISLMCDVNGPPAQIDIQGLDGKTYQDCTALEIAVLRGKLDIAHVLLNTGAIITTRVLELLRSNTDVFGDFSQLFKKFLPEGETLKSKVSSSSSY